MTLTLGELRCCGVSGLGDHLRVGPQTIPPGSQSGVAVIQRGPHMAPIAKAAPNGKFQFWAEGELPGSYVPQQTVVGVMGLGVGAAAGIPAPKAQPQIQALNRQARDMYQAGLHDEAQGVFNEAQAIARTTDDPGYFADDFRVTAQILAGDQSANQDYAAAKQLVAAGAQNAKPGDPAAAFWNSLSLDARNAAQSGATQGVFATLLAAVPTWAKVVGALVGGLVVLPYVAPGIKAGLGILRPAPRSSNPLWRRRARRRRRAR